MPVINNILLHSKQLMLFVSLFWAFLLCGHAYALDALGSQVMEQLPLPETSESSALSAEHHHLVQAATTSSVSVKLEQAELDINFSSFLVPADEDIPPYAARAPGQSFLTRIFPSIIQPNAP